MKILVFVAMILFISSCGTSKKAFVANENWNQKKPSSEAHIIETMVLLGDAGKLDGETNLVVEALKAKLQAISNTKTLVILGDNIYPNGLLSSNNPLYQNKEKIINEQLELLDYIDGNNYVIPGNHDWNNSSPGGRDFVLRQEAHVSSRSNASRTIEWLPKSACGDPELRESSSGLSMLFLDSQWWNHKWKDELAINQGCDIQSRDQFLEKIRVIFEQHKNKRMLVFLHHPLKSNGAHGGRFPFKHHIFPLTAIKKYLYIPLPIIGSLYPLLRSSGLSRQDIPNKHNGILVNALLDFAESNNVEATFITGHEHSLGFFESGDLDFIVSGSGAKVSYAEKGHDASYVRGARGYALLHRYSDNSSWVEYYILDNKTGIEYLDFRSQVWVPKKN